MQEELYTDVMLLDRLRTDDTYSFEELYRRHWRMMYMFAMKKLGSRSEARKIVATVFADLWKERHNIPVDFSFQFYLYQKVRHAVIEELHQCLSNPENNNWIDELVLPYFNGQVVRPAINEEMAPAMLAVERKQRIFQMEHVAEKTGTWQQVMDFFHGPTESLSKWMLLSKHN